MNDENPNYQPTRVQWKRFKAILHLAFEFQRTGTEIRKEYGKKHYYGKCEILHYAMRSFAFCNLSPKAKGREWMQTYRRVESTALFENLQLRALIGASTRGTNESK